MANILLVTGNVNYQSNQHLIDVFVLGDHDVTLIESTNLPSQSLQGFDLVVAHLMPNNEDSSWNILLNHFNEGNPIMTGTMAGIGSGSTASREFAVKAGLVSKSRVLGSSIGFLILNNKDDLFYKNHSYGMPFRATLNSEFKFSLSLPAASGMNVIAFDQGNANSSYSSICIASFEKGCVNLFGEQTKSRYIFNGYLIANGGFTDNQKQAMLKMIDWLTTDIVLNDITGKITLEDQPHTSKVVVTSVNETPTVLGYGQSDIAGDYSINVGEYNGPVLIHTMQDYGLPWSASTAKVIGGVVHPTVPNGYIYKVTQAGNTGTVEPTWTAEQNVSINDGSVIYQSERLLKPEIEGYVTPTPIA